MDSSSSEELTSDEEIEELIESAWNKTKSSLHDSDSDFDKSQSEHSENDNLNDSDGPCFVLDKNPSSSKSDVLEREKEDSENDVGNEDSSLFVVDKNPSLLKASQSEVEKISSDKKSARQEKKHQRRLDKRMSKSIELSSSLKVNWDPSNIYITLHSKHSPKPKKEISIQRINKEAEEIMKKSVVTPDFEKKDAVPTQEESRRQKQKERKKERERTKGKGWFNLPKGEITEETKNDLMALKMRRALDPKRFYKGDDIKGIPKYFQFGTVVEDASEFYSARIPKKMRKKSMVDELMADAEFRKFNKRKYVEIQDMKSKGLGPYQGVRTMKTKKKKKK